MNQEIISTPIGPEGSFGSADVAIVNGKLQVAVTLSPKALLDAAAKKIGGTIPTEIVAFLEKTIGLN